MKLVALVCLCLVTRCGITAAGVNGPKVVEEGSDVILPCSLSTKENIQLKVFDWTKDAQRNEGRKEVFLYDAGIHYNNGRSGQSQAFEGRVSHFPDQLENGNASIIIRNTKVTDSGNYTCHFPRLQPPQMFRLELVVYRVLKDRTDENITDAAPKPDVTQLKASKDWSQLQCVVRGASPKPRLQWKDSKGNILPTGKPQVSKSGDRYDVILQVTVTKTDNYSCVATQETICHQTYKETHVYIHGAAPKPSVTQLEQTKDWSRLQCEVQGNPEPKVEWQDSDGNNLTAEEPQVSKSGDRYDVILQVKVTKTDRYRCVATQETISHQTSTETHVYIGADRSEGNSESSTGWVGIVVTFFVTAVVVLGVGVLVLVYRRRMKQGSRPVPTSDTL